MTEQVRVLPQKDENKLLIKKRKRIYAEANQALKGKLDWIIDWTRKESARGLISRYELGTVVKEIYDDEKADGSVYGKNSFQKIALFTGEDPGLIRMAMRLVNCFTLEQVEQLAATIMADGITPLSYSHVRQLLTIDNSSARETALQKTVNNTWTSGQLGEYIHNLSHHGNGLTDDFSSRSPKTINGLLLQQQKFADDWETKCEHFLDPSQSLSAKAKGLSNDEITEELAKKIYNLHQQQLLLVGQITKMANETESQYKHIRLVLDSRNGTKPHVTERAVSRSSSRIPALSEDE